jgi:hypothetical protein
MYFFVLKLKLLNLLPDLRYLFKKAIVSYRAMVVNRPFRPDNLTKNVLRALKCSSDRETETASFTG